MRTTIAEYKTPGPRPYIPLPWEVFCEFAHMILVGCVMTFGPRLGQRKLVEEPALLHSRSSSFTLETPHSLQS